MPRNKTPIPIAPILRLMKKSCGQRVSRLAAKEVVEYLETYIQSCSKNAVDVAKHGGRSTILERDIRLSM